MEPREYHKLRAVEDDHWWFLSLNQFVVETLARRLPEGDRRLLDAGCGTGGLLVHLSRLGRAEGIDASPLAVELARERGLDSVRVEDLNALQLDPRAYDAIVSLDVLYHDGIRDESAVLRALYEALRPGGVLFLHLPAFEALRSRHDRQVHTRRRYRMPRVRRLLRDAGFEQLHGSYRVTLLAPAMIVVRGWHALARRFGGGAPGSDLENVSPGINRLLLAVSRWENAISRRLPLPFGVSLYAVAVRPPEGGTSPQSSPR